MRLLASPWPTPTAPSSAACSPPSSLSDALYAVGGPVMSGGFRSDRGDYLYYAAVDSTGACGARGGVGWGGVGWGGVGWGGVSEWVGSTGSAWEPGPEQQGGVGGRAGQAVGRHLCAPPLRRTRHSTHAHANTANCLLSRFARTPLSPGAFHTLTSCVVAHSHAFNLTNPAPSPYTHTHAHRPEGRPLQRSGHLAPQPAEHPARRAARRHRTLRPPAAALPGAAGGAGGRSQGA